MADLKITYTEKHQELNHETNKFVTTYAYSGVLTELKYNNMTSKETIKFFEGLGGTERVTRKCGRVVKLVSTSPSGELRTIRTFKFSE